MRTTAIVLALSAAFCIRTAHAAPEVLWKQDFGNLKDGQAVAGGEIVEDAAATGGKALRLTYAKEGNLPSIVRVTGITLAGHGTLQLLVRSQGLNDISSGLRLSVNLQPESGKGALSTASGAAYGIRSPEGAYRVLPISLLAGDEPASYTMTVAASWTKQAAGRTPVVWLGGMELSGNGKNAPYIGGLLRRALDYAPGATAKVSATVVNPTQTAFNGKVVLRECFGLDGCRDAVQSDVALAAGETHRMELNWTATAPDAGRMMVLSLLDKDGKELDRDQVPVGISRDSREFSFPMLDFVDGRWCAGGPSYYIGNMGYGQMKREVETALRDRSCFGGRREIYGWAWCDLAGLVPPEDPYIGNEGQRWACLKTKKQQVALLNEMGYTTQSYIGGIVADIAGMALFERHPDWFMYSANGEIVSYNTEALNDYSRRHDYDFAIKYHEFTFSSYVDPTRPEVREWIAGQIIHMSKEMGIRGVRWDVWNLNVWPGCRRLDGTEIAPTWPEADRLTAESMKAVKDLVAKEIPDFTWGYNMVGPEENKDTPLTLAEKCRGHGWMLDEIEICYGEKISPYHFWNAYDTRMVEWGDHIRQLGGIYDPWPFHRGDMQCGCSDADWLYSSIFRVLAGGRVWLGIYKNNSALVGDLPLLAFRFGESYSGWNLRLQPEDQKRISVEAPETVWWKGHVLANKTFDGKDQFIVHLVNAPMAAEVKENQDSKARPPARDVKVVCNALGGRLPQKAWLLMAEPLTPDLEPQVQAVSLTMEKQGAGVAVTVPSVLFLKTVVFEY